MNWLAKLCRKVLTLNTDMCNMHIQTLPRRLKWRNWEEQRLSWLRGLSVANQHLCAWDSEWHIWCYTEMDLSVNITIVLHRWKETCLNPNGMKLNQRKVCPKLKKNKNRYLEFILLVILLVTYGNINLLILVVIDTHQEDIHPHY